MSLPEPFLDLLPLYQTWAAGDDLQRALRIADAADEDLRSLVAQLAPHVEAISAYCDSLAASRPTAEQANLLRVAELAAEAERELSFREAGNETGE